MKVRADVADVNGNVHTPTMTLKNAALLALIGTILMTALQAVSYTHLDVYKRQELQIAHEIAPDDIEVQRAWLSMLPRKERLAALEAYLAGSHPDDDEETKWMAEYLEFLKATIDKPIHACRLVSKVEQTDTKLETMYCLLYTSRCV